MRGSKETELTPLSDLAIENCSWFDGSRTAVPPISRTKILARIFPMKALDRCLSTGSLVNQSQQASAADNNNNDKRARPDEKTSTSSSRAGQEGEEDNEDPFGIPPRSQQPPKSPYHTYNPTPQELPPPSTALAGTQGDRLVLVMVGLPARGKTYIAR